MVSREGVLGHADLVLLPVSGLLVFAKEQQLDVGWRDACLLLNCLAAGQLTGKVCPGCRRSACRPAGSQWQCIDPC